TDLVQCAMQLQKHILKKFLCVRSAARESIGDAEYTPLVGAHKMAESLYIAASCPLQAGRAQARFPFLVRRGQSGMLCIHEVLNAWIGREDAAGTEFCSIRRPRAPGCSQNS